MNSLVTLFFFFLNILFQLGLKKTLLKRPGCAGSLSRKSSSSGSVSAVISNVCASPAAGRGKAGGALRPQTHLCPGPQLCAHSHLDSAEGSGGFAVVWRGEGGHCVRVPALTMLPVL